MAWKGKNILITGATHFIAGHLAERLIGLGGSVKALVRYDYQNNCGSLDNLPVHIRNRIEVFHGSLTNPEVIDFATRGAHVVFHFGVLDMLPFYINARDYLEKTVLGTFNVLNVAKQHEVQRFVHISTAEVYGKVADMPISEGNSLKAQSPHISSDIGAEKLVEGFHLSYNLPVTIARLFNTYGPMQSKGAIIPTIITQGIVGTRILLGNMRPIRDFIYVEDVVSGLIKMAEVPESIGKAINLGSGHGISVGDLAEKIIDLIGTDIEILFDAARIRPQSSDMEQMIADIARASELLGWQPEISLGVGLERTIEWFAKHVRI